MVNYLCVLGRKGGQRGKTEVSSEDKIRNISLGVDGALWRIQLGNVQWACGYQAEPGKNSSDEEGFYKNKLIKLQKVCAKPYKK